MMVHVLRLPLRFYSNRIHYKRTESALPSNTAAAAAAAAASTAAAVIYIPMKTI